MTYEEMVKLNIDTKMTKADLVEMMCEDMGDQIEAGIKALKEEESKLQKQVDVARDKYLWDLVKDLKISMDKGAEVKTSLFKSVDLTKSQLAAIERHRDEYTEVPMMDRDRNCYSNIPSFPYNCYRNKESFEIPSTVQLVLDEKQTPSHSQVSLISITKSVEIQLTEHAVKELTNMLRENVFKIMLLKCRIAIEGKKLAAVLRAAPKFRAQITKKILESSPDGQKVITMLNGVSRKMNARAITEK